MCKVVIIDCNLTIVEIISVRKCASNTWRYTEYLYPHNDFETKKSMHIFKKF